MDRCRLRQVQGGPAPGEGAKSEPGGRIRGRCRLGQIQGDSAPDEGTMEEPGGRSRGRCRLGHVQGGSAPGEGAMEDPGDEVGAGAGLERYRVVKHLLREP